MLSTICVIKSRAGSGEQRGNRSMYKLKFLSQLLFIDIYFHNACRNTFEYKQHKATLKKRQKERTILDKVLGLYSSSRTHAPHHMKMYKTMRVLNLLLCLLGIVLTYVSAVEPYIDTIYFVYTIVSGIVCIVDYFSVFGFGDIPDFDGTGKP